MKEKIFVAVFLICLSLGILMCFVAFKKDNEKAFVVNQKLSVSSYGYELQTKGYITNTQFYVELYEYGSYQYLDTIKCMQRDSAIIVLKNMQRFKQCK